MLEVIDDQQQRFGLKIFREQRLRVTARVELESDGFGQCRQDELIRSQPLQSSEEHAIHKHVSSAMYVTPIGYRDSGLQCQSRFPHSAGADQGQQTAVRIVEQSENFG